MKRKAAIRLIKYYLPMSDTEAGTLDVLFEKMERNINIVLALI